MPSGDACSEQPDDEGIWDVTNPTERDLIFADNPARIAAQSGTVEEEKRLVAAGARTAKAAIAADIAAQMEAERD